MQCFTRIRHKTFTIHVHNFSDCSLIFVHEVTAHTQQAPQNALHVNQFTNEHDRSRTVAPLLKSQGTCDCSYSHNKYNCELFVIWFVIFNTCAMHLLSFCTIPNKCTVISQIIALLHVSTISCHPQVACNQYLAKLYKYFICSCWQYLNSLLHGAQSFLGS